jgi:undecaprenyl-diphosphatase
LILGAVQGITEFLPVSSSAHLIITSWMVNGDALPMALNVALHLGTLSAVIMYFWKDWVGLTKAGLQFVRTRNMKNPSFHLLIGIILGSFPAGVIGLVFKDEIEKYFHNPLFTAGPLLLVGILLWWVDKRSKHDRHLNQITLKDAVIIGCAQALALIPGTSRSGITMVGGRLLGFDRQSAARFSFLLGTPAMLGAALLHYKQLLQSFTQPVFYIGFFSSLVVGVLAIQFLLRFLRQYGFLAFAIYRSILAIILFVILA